jgi:hypothetical protein
MMYWSVAKDREENNCCLAFGLSIQANAFAPEAMAAR